MDILDKIIGYKKKEVEKLKSLHSLDFKHIHYDYEARNNTFKVNMMKPGISVIAEVKRKSPSAGELKKDFDPVKMAKEYENKGAEAVSVLTDKKFFGGKARYLSDIKNAVKLPVLRKDFIIDSFQLHESKFLGADCILLIARILDPARLKDFITAARNLGMSSLVEVHSEQEIEKSLTSGAEIIGINNRDLDTFTVDIKKSLELIKVIPDHIIKISESGIKTSSQVGKLYQAGFDGVLIGETLMRSEQPGSLIQKWKQEVSCTIK